MEEKEIRRGKAKQKWQRNFQRVSAFSECFFKWVCGEPIWKNSGSRFRTGGRDWHEKQGPNASSWADLFLDTSARPFGCPPFSQTGNLSARSSVLLDMKYEPCGLERFEMYSRAIKESQKSHCEDSCQFRNRLERYLPSSLKKSFQSLHIRAVVKMMSKSKRIYWLFCRLDPLTADW